MLPTLQNKKKNYSYTDDIVITDFVWDFFRARRNSRRLTALLLWCNTHMSLYSNLLLKSRFYCYHAILNVWYVFALLCDESSRIKSQVSNIFGTPSRLLIMLTFFVQSCTRRLGFCYSQTVAYLSIGDGPINLDAYIVWMWKPGQYHSFTG